MSFAKILSRDEMKNVQAGNVYIECDGCQNSTCRGFALDCTSGAYQICGPGSAGSDGPAGHSCTPSEMIA